MFSLCFANCARLCGLSSQRVGGNAIFLSFYIKASCSRMHMSTEIARELRSISFSDTIVIVWGYSGRRRRLGLDIACLDFPWAGCSAVSPGLVHACMCIQTHTRVHPLLALHRSPRRCLRLTFRTRETAPAALSPSLSWAFKVKNNNTTSSFSHWKTTPSQGLPGNLMSLTTKNTHT